LENLKYEEEKQASKLIRNGMDCDA
jgi:hypothetical protein